MREFKNQHDLFDHLWNTREHISELSGKPLLPKTDYRWIWQFLHCLPKGTYPKYKLNPENIILALPDEHTNQEQYQVYNDKKLALTREYYARYYGKVFDED